MMDTDQRISPAQANCLGISRNKTGWGLSFFDTEIRLDPNGNIGNDDPALSPALREVLTAYVTATPDAIPDSMPGEMPSLLTFREFSGAAPLFASFTANTAKTIERQFSGRLDLLARRARSLRGETCKDQRLSGLGFDVSVRFTALPKIPVILNFNDADEFMPATAAFLFEETASEFLSLKHLMTLATYRTGRLIRS